MQPMILYVTRRLYKNSTATACVLRAMPKNIVLCLDGTANEYGDHHTNVLRLFSIIEKNDLQQTYYDPGVGTLSAPTMWSSIGKKISKSAGLAFGAGLVRNISEAYMYLMDCFEDEDRVFIFGFSRGAYTARALAAFIVKCGLLNRGNENLVPYAVKIFRHERRPKIYGGFRKTFSRRCRIHFLGLWDTVKSYGWVYDPISLQFTKDNPIVGTIRHAVAIDERRAFYRQNLWGKGHPDQDIKQVWFAGVHSDIGGGYREDERGPADIALDWMVGQAQPDLLIDRAKLRRLLPEGSVCVTAPKIHESLKGYWVALEYLPRTYRDPNDNWKRRWIVYGGRRRHIGDGALIHQSVIDRMNESEYAPSNLPPTYHIEPW